MRVLESVGLRSLRRSAGRFALTAAGITLGVAVVFGVLVTNDTTSREVARRIQTETEPTVQVRPVGAHGGDIPVERVKAIAELPGVRKVEAGLGYFVRLTPAGARDERALSVHGWTTVRGPAFSPAPRRGPADALNRTVGRAPAPGADEVGVNAELSRRMRVPLGRQIQLPTPDGEYRFTLVHTTERRDGRPPDGDYAYTSLETMQRILGKRGVVQTVSVTLARGTDERRWAARHAAEIGPSLRAQPSEDAVWRRQLRDTARFGQASFTGAATIAVFVGAFLIYITLSMAVAERTQMYGTFRALGASRRQVRRVVIAEAAALGAGSAVAGVVVGLLVAVAMVRLTGAIYGLERPALVVRPWTVGVAAAVGVLMTLASALVPSRRAARLEPIAAIREPYAQTARVPRTWVLGLCLFAAGLAGSVASMELVTGLDGPLLGLVWLPALALLTGSVLLVPLVMGPVARVVGRATGRMTAGVGDVAVMHLVKERSRSAYTLALVMVVLAMIFSIRAGERSWIRTAERSMHHLFPADVGVSAWQQLDPADVTAIREVRGVAAVTEIRFGQTTVRPDGPEATVVMIDPRSYFALQGFAWSRGADDDARSSLERGGAVLVPEAFALERRLRLGSPIRLDTSAGSRRFRVAGVYAGIDNAASPRLVVGLHDGRELFGAGKADVVAVRVRDGADPERVARAITTRFTDRLDLTARTTQARGRDVLTGFVRFMRILYAVVLVAAVIGLLGLANTVAISVFRRTREIGLLRAVGTRRRQVRAMVVVESATLAAVAFALAIPLGWLESVILIRGAAAAVGGAFHYAYPWGMIPVLGLLAFAIAILAAVAPARRAARVDPVTSLRFE